MTLIVAGSNAQTSLNGGGEDASVPPGTGRYAIKLYGKVMAKLFTMSCHTLITTMRNEVKTRIIDNAQSLGRCCYCW